MSDDETPSRQHPAMSKDMTVSDYRLQEVERAVRALSRQVKDFMDTAHDKESAHIVAIERCSAHGTKIDSLDKSTEERLRIIHKRIDGIRITGGGPTKRETISFWTALAALGSGLGAWLTQYFHKGAP